MINIRYFVEIYASIIYLLRIILELEGDIVPSTNMSWSKPLDKENLLGKKKVDLSIFKYGIHIPQEYHKDFLSIIPGNYIELGTSEKIKLILDNRIEEVELRNVNSKGRSGDTLQIIYDTNKDLIDYFIKKFRTSYDYIMKNQGSNGSRIIVPDNIAEYIEVYYTGKPYEYKLTLINNSEIKDKFFNYIGEHGTLNNSLYQKSYKLVLLLSMINNTDEEGKAEYDKVCKDILKFYKKRHEQGLLVEQNDSRIQTEIETLTLSVVKSIMNENAFKVISDKGYILKEYLNNNEYILFNRELWQALSSNDLKLLEENIRDKLDIYYTTRVERKKETKDGKREETVMIDEMSSEEIIQYIHQYITSRGYTYSLDTIKNFYLSLKTKPFVLLAGISGTGKSKLVELYAEAIGANVDNGRYNLIPVRPDWSDPSDLLGYRNIKGHFQPGPLTNIIKKAVDDTDNLPYFICLDEMNLARVEYYFSDILSIIETRKGNGRIITNKLLKEEFFGDDEESKAKYSYLYIPDNLYIIGTVNMDETTFPFSKKVLDRANTIEFNHVKLSVDFESLEDHIDELKPLVLKNDMLSSNYVKLKDCIDEKEHIEEVIYLLEKINSKLEEVGLQFGYRIRDEIIFYTLYSTKEKLMSFDMAMDYAIKQKILPRVQGSNISIKSALIELFKIFINNTSSQYDPYANDNFEKMHNYIKNNNVKYPLCAEKICSMIRRHEVDGFTTFWE